ncbi:TonB-dependent siderophore receptor [Microvirga arsenatis]|uniref:TonB-dependent siderophore receptor n=1 Tax=Microvirga arsenatis TaxID=2692265 RepID=A0ABW9Z2Q6_9HYPH|nr:TonB-dependent siderophore receptor [Microvirga arsenatis]NBJ13418.1 TonB-dependent siderophore receptor [Microvirga arsenatis]NBJ26964.1 TonB-dependent siderophore receptor [Microvirga arsenatis]
MLMKVPAVHLRLALLASSALILVPGAALAQVNEARTIQLDEVTVEGQGAGQEGAITANGYVATATRSATKTDTPVLETPQSVSVVTQQQLEDRKPQSLLDAVSYTPGARVGSYGFDPRYDAFSIRGIDVTYTGVFRDGLRQVNSPNGLFRLEPYGLEGISILRGPAASIYGASSTGGIVDLISKRPTFLPFREVEVQTGSYGRLQGAFDLSGPVTSDNTLFYRLTGLVRDAGTEIDAVRDDRAYIAPALTWKPTDSTTLTLLGEYMDATTGGTAAYINNYATDAAGNPTSLSVGATRVFAGDPRYNDFRQQQGRIGYEFEHRFNDMFTLRQRTRFSALGTNQEYVYGGSGLTRENNWGIVSDTHLETRLRTGDVDHTILSGLDVSRLSYVSKQGFGVIPIGTDPVLNYREEQTQTLTGIYIQDQVKWQNWRLTLGGRHDWLTSEYNTAGFEYDRDDTKFTGRAALGYVTDFGLAPYVSYGTSFTPNPGTILGGGVAEPTTGEQVEVGVKYDLPGMNASLRAAVFDLRQDNAVVYQVVDATNRQVQLDLRSQGFELEGVASLAEGLSVQASYTYTDARILKLTPETEGKRLTSVPYHMASLWLDYTVQEGPARGLGIAGGVRYVGSSFGDNLNRPIIENEPRTYLDAALRYYLENIDPSLKGLRLQVNASNLLDEDGQVCTSNYCYFDEGRKVVASLRYRW